MKVFKKYYFYLPVFMQNLAISFFGFIRDRTRHGGRYSKHLALYNKTYRYSKAEHEKLQLSELRLELENAIKNVDFYKRNPAYNSINIENFQLESLRGLPILDKDMLRNSKNSIVTSTLRKKDVVISHTSGTTGTPFSYYLFKDDLRKRMALLERFRNHFGVKEGDRCATFTGNTIVPLNQSRPPFWRFNYFGNQMLFSTYHLSDSNLSSYVKRLNEFKPYIIEGYPSALYVISKFILNQNIKLTFVPKLILSTAETLQDFQKDIIEAALKNSVRNYYGSSDGAPLIMECRESKFHLVPESGIFEIINSKNEKVIPNEMGELIVTTLFSKAQPVIRYKTGDMVVQGDPAYVCKCGNMAPTVSSIIGRKDDMIYSEERGWVGRISQLPKLFPKYVKESQFIQKEPDSIIIKIVLENGNVIKEEDFVDFKNDFALRLGKSMKMEIQYVDEIPRNSNNKFKFVDSKFRLS